MGQFSFGIQIRINSVARKHIICWCVFMFMNPLRLFGRCEAWKLSARALNTENWLTAPEINLARQNWFDIVRLFDTENGLAKKRSHSGFWQFLYFCVIVVVAISCHGSETSKFVKVLTTFHLGFTFFFPLRFTFFTWHSHNYIYDRTDIRSRRELWLSVFWSGSCWIRSWEAITWAI